MNKRTLHEGKWLRLMAEGRWEFVERTHSADAVAIVAVTDDNCLLLVEQPRIPLDGQAIELPAGLVGDEAQHAHESLAAAAARELQEETGYRPGRIEFLCRGPSSAGLTSEVINFFYADDLHYVQPAGGLPGENIVLHKVPLATIHTWIDEKTAAGLLIDYRVYVALYWVGRRKAAGPT